MNVYDTEDLRLSLSAACEQPSVREMPANERRAPESVESSLGSAEQVENRRRALNL